MSTNFRDNGFCVDFVYISKKFGQILSLVGQILTHLLCTLPGRRPGTAEGGKRPRPGRVLVFFVHFFPAHIRSGK